MSIFLSFQPRLTLRTLLLSLITVSGSLILLNTLFAVSHVQRQALIDSTLEGNRVYAVKLADSLAFYLGEAQHTLTYTATQLATPLDIAALSSILQQLQEHTPYFNSVYVANMEGHLESVWPAHLQAFEGQLLNIQGTHASLGHPHPLISPPYISIAGNLMIQVSSPLLDTQGLYRGYLGGAIYLHDSPLQQMMEIHPFQNGTYVYVVDFRGRLIYHPQKKRIGQLVDDNPVVKQLMQGRSGQQKLITSQGEDMLAGYAALPELGWGIVVQRPTADTLASLDDLIRDVAKNTVPLLAFIVPVLWWLARLISAPLQRLAAISQNMGGEHCISQLEAINGWYYEVRQMRRALLLGVSAIQQKLQQLNVDAQRDPLTGLYNRRGLEEALNTWSAQAQGFSAIALDIDFFKRVNDTYGHDQGDRVIQAIGRLMREQARDSDIVCRTGGEEFLLLLPKTPLAEACLVAERLRCRVGDYNPIAHHPLSISLGVSCYDPNDSLSPEQVLIKADQALYAAKRNGRNQVIAN